MVGSWGKVEQSPPHFVSGMGMGIVASPWLGLHEDNSHDVDTKLRYHQCDALLNDREPIPDPGGHWLGRHCGLCREIFCYDYQGPGFWASATQGSLPAARIIYKKNPGAFHNGQASLYCPN